MRVGCRREALILVPSVLEKDGDWNGAASDWSGDVVFCSGGSRLKLVAGYAFRPDRLVPIEDHLASISCAAKDEPAWRCYLRFGTIYLT